MIVISFIVFSNTYRNTFHIDDYDFIVKNTGIRSIMPLTKYFKDISAMEGTSGGDTGNYRPLMALSFAVNYALGGLDPAGYHFFNLIINITAAVLMFFICLELQKQAFPSGDITARMDIAFAAAVLFAVHPVTGISVNYISNRSLLLMEMFFCASFLMYIRMREGKETAYGYAAVLVMFLCSILSKKNSYVMPLMILSYEVIVRNEKAGGSGVWKRFLPFLLLPFLLSLYEYVKGFSEFAMQTSLASTSALGYFFTQAKLHLSTYFVNIFYPYNIHENLNVPVAGFFEPGVIAGLLFIAVTVALAIRLRKKHPLVSFCVLSYWIMMLPESSFMPLYSLRVDYRPYPSSPYLYFLLAFILYRFLEPVLRGLLFWGVLSYISIASYNMNKVWLSEYSFWRDSAEHCGGCFPYMNLAMNSPDMNDRKRYLEKALEASPDNYLANVNYGFTLMNMGYPEKGFDVIRRTAERNPRIPMVRFSLAKAYSSMNKIKEAYGEAKAAASLEPQNAEYAYQTALLAQSLGEYDASLVFTNTVLKADPNYEDIYFLHAFGLQKMGRTDECVPAYRACLAKTPEHVLGWFNLGYALKDKGRYREAIECFRNVLRITPDNNSARSLLSLCYKMSGEKVPAEFEDLVLSNK